MPGGGAKANGARARLSRLFKLSSSAAFFPVPVLLVDLSILSASPEHAVRPRGNALLLRGIVIVREEVVLVRGRKVNRALLEAREDIPRPVFDLEDIKEWGIGYTCTYLHTSFLSPSVDRRPEVLPNSLPPPEILPRRGAS